jgi:hypothetical protein
MRMPGLPCFAALVLCAGCDSPRPAGGERSGHGATSAPTASALATSPLPQTSAAAGDRSSRVPLAGRWVGTYRASRAAIELPRGLPAGAWTEDDGAVASGDGRIELEVQGDSELRGKLDGPLGSLVTRGMVEGDSLRAGVSPSDPMADPAMIGILTAVREGQDIVGELRVSSHDGRLVRSSPVRLQRQ